MNSNGNRTRLAGVLAAVAAALALVALPGLASAHHDHSPPADAGTIQSFDAGSGVLTIALTEGGSVSGLVTPRTHVVCDRGLHRGRRGMRHHLRHARASDSPGRGNPGAEGPRGEGEGRPEGGEGHDGTAPGRSEGPGEGAEHAARCTSEDLTEGTTVKFADLALLDGKAIYNLVALPKPAS